MNKALAWKIYEALNAKGAGLGNASVLFIEKALDENSSKIFEFTGRGAIVIIRATNSFHAHDLLINKMRDEGLRHDDIGVDRLIECGDSTNPETGHGVIAWFDQSMPDLDLE